MPAGSESLGRPPPPAEDPAYAHGLQRRAQFRTVRRLGTGTQATVRLALYTPTGQAFAVKAFRRPKRPLSASAATLKTAGPESGVTAELLVRRRLQLAGPHPCQEHIVKLYEHFVTEEKAYLVFELCAGMDLQHCMQARGGCFPEDEARPIIATVLRTLTYLHGIGIVHRDVKPANILVRDPNRIAETLCLADFGGAFVADVVPGALRHPSASSLGSVTLAGSGSLAGSSGTISTPTSPVGPDLPSPFRASSAAVIQSRPMPPGLLLPRRSSSALMLVTNTAPLSGIPTAPPFPFLQPTGTSSTDLGAQYSTSPPTTFRSPLARSDSEPALGSSPILQPTAPRDHPLTMHTITGTPYFLPPELVMGLPYGPKVDCWALGCTAHAVLVGETPFASAANLAELYGMIQAGELHLPGSVSDEARGFLSMLLQPDPAARASAAAALGHPWLAGEGYEVTMNEKGELVLADPRIRTDSGFGEEESAWAPGWSVRV